MKKMITVALSLVLMLGMAGFAIAGSLDAPGAPSAGSGMYTLQNLYDYIVSGAALESQTGFQEPTSAPGSTMKTTKEIGDMLKSLYEQCPVTAANVESGVKFFCTQPGSWGVQTGTGLMQPTPTPTPTITPTITPTPWGPTPCAAKGGYWATMGSKVTGNGCWFDPGGGEGGGGDNCNTICSNLNKGLVCDTQNWNDSSTCEVCHYFHGGFPANCYDNGTNWAGDPHWDNRASYHSCSTRADGEADPISQDCSQSAQTTVYTRYCVCKPSPL